MTNYGYLTMSNTAADGFPSTIISWSFDNTGAPITIPVPEPTTAALLSVTALVLVRPDCANGAGSVQLNALLS